MTTHEKGQQSRPRIRLKQRSKEVEVGYRKPPRRHQFKSGQSGNLRGRPKGSKNASTIVREILARKIQNRSGGRVRRITVQEGILLRLIDDALKGNVKSMAFLFDRFKDTASGDIQVRTYRTVAEIRAEMERRGLLPTLRRVVARESDENDEPESEDPQQRDSSDA
jgi:hypothetical protein